MKVLLDLGVTGNFISYAMVVALKLKITLDVDFQDLTLADGSKVWIAGYVQLTINCGGYKGKIIARVFPNLSKECIQGVALQPSGAARSQVDQGERCGYPK